MKAVQFGAGKIGRGFLGQLLFEGGYETTFVDADLALVDALNRRGAYPLRLISAAGVQDLVIGNVRAIHAADTQEVTAALAEADLCGTSVGATILLHVAPLLAAGVKARANAGAGPCSHRRSAFKKVGGQKIGWSKN